MAPSKQAFAFVAFAGLAIASPAPQQLDLGALDAAPTVASGPTALVADSAAETASLYTSVSVANVATASVTGSATAKAIKARDTGSTPYYAALATGYTTDPALGTATTTAGQACPTQPEAGTYCGFINPEDPCSPQPDGYGPVPSPDTASAFLAYPSLHSLAQAAPTTVPSVNNTIYNQVFKDLNASTSAQSYLGLYSLKTYDVAGCAQKCDDTSLCTAFNIYAERDPSLNPSNNDSTAPTVWGYYCPNPASMTVFKCTLWGSNIDASTATNTGETREQFQVVITASDGYDKTNSTIPPDCTPPDIPESSSIPVATFTSTTSAVASPTTASATSKTSSTTTSKAVATPSSPSSPAWPDHPWGKPNNCGGKAINAGKYWMGSRFFPGPFNPQVCSDYALLQNRANAEAKNAQSCQMFNAYYLHKNNVPFGTYCALYSTHLDNSWATFSTQWSGSDRFDCKQSWTYTLSH